MIELILGLLLDLAGALFLAVPIMLLTALLHAQGAAGVPPLGYWVSYGVALLIMWIFEAINVPGWIHKGIFES